MGKSLLRCWLLLLTIAVFLIGCGGNGSSSSESRSATLHFSLDWPERNRSVPVLAESALVVVTKGQTELARTVLNRPSGDAAAVGAHDFPGLPTGAVTITVTAYQQADGAGSVLATGTSSATLAKGTTTPQQATMTSSVATLELTPSASSVVVGTPVTVALSAKDSNGAIVLLKTEDLQEDVVWSSGTTSVATVEGNSLSATVTTLTAGTSAIKAHLTNGAIEQSTTITVTAPVLTTANFTMPWTFTGGDAPDTWQSIKATLMSGSTEVSSQIINRTDSINQITFSDLTIGGTYSIAYKVYSSVGAEGSVVWQDSGEIEASAEATSYTFASAPFHAAPMSISLSAGTSTGYLYVGSNYVMLDWMGSGQLVATASYTDGSTSDVTNSATWSLTGATNSTLSSTGFLQLTTYSDYGNITVSYAGITRSYTYYAGI